MELSIQKLQSLLQDREDLKQALQTSLQKAAQPGIKTLDEFYAFLHEMLTYIPTQKEINANERKVFLSNQ
jgi:hypothetical protein